MNSNIQKHEWGKKTFPLKTNFSSLFTSLLNQWQNGCFIFFSFKYTKINLKLLIGRAVQTNTPWHWIEKKKAIDIRFISCVEYNANGSTATKGKDEKRKVKKKTILIQTIINGMDFFYYYRSEELRNSEWRANMRSKIKCEMQLENHW